MKFTNLQTIALSDAITFLDGQNVMQVVEGKVVAVFRSYRIAAAARWSLARAQGKLQAVIADYNRAKDSLLNHHSGGKGVLKQTDPSFNEFVADWEKLKQTEVNIELEQIAPEQLKLEENEKLGNELPIAVLMTLAPLIASKVQSPESKA